MTTRIRAAMVAMSVAAAGALAGIAVTRGAGPGPLPAPRLHLQPRRIVADGYDTAKLGIESAANTPPTVTIVGNSHVVRLDGISGGRGRWEARIRAAIVPGRVRLRVAFRGAPAAEANLDSVLFARDSAQDGTPDFLRLDDERDRQSFRHWFTWLAEAQYFQTHASRPESNAEIQDCAALLRYAYREALRAHDRTWTAAATGVPPPPFASVAKFQYPFTPLGAALFRVREGSFEASDLAAGESGGAFGQFADVRTLYRLNTHLVGRVLSSAVPGDLLFFRQDSGTEPYHSMIYLGHSQIRDDGRLYILYHTGPNGADPGEIRRLTVEELMHFPQAEWRPIAANPSFLGVSRWNILRKENDTRVP